MKRTIALLLAILMLGSVAVFTGCSGAKDSYTIGICQLVQHDALDAATQGFKDYLTEKLGDKVTFDEQNANNESDKCATICNQFVANNVDLIMANATPAVNAAKTSTDTIPVLGTSVTEYGVALGIDNFDGVTGINVSGTSDLPPLDQQAAMIKELVPTAKKVGILYCSTEANSKYQATEVAKALKELGIDSKEYTFTDSNDAAAVTKTACDECDTLYIPTDNTAASNAELINNVAKPAGVPIIAGEEGICKGCGIGTLSISYYDIGYKTGEMAYDILVNGEDITKMEIQYAPEFTKKYNKDLCKALKIEVPDDYEAIK